MTVKSKKQYENLNPTLQSSETSLFLALLPEQQKPRSNVIGRKLKNQYHLLVHSLKSCLTLGDLKGCSPWDFWTWDFPGQYTRVGCHFLLQRIFSTEVKNPRLLHFLPMQYCSLQHQTLLLSPVTSTTGHYFRFDSVSSIFLELFLHRSPIAYWAPTDLGSSSFSVLSFCLFILLMGFSMQEYWSGCHSLLQWTMFWQNSPPWPIRLGWPYMAWLVVSLS